MHFFDGIQKRFVFEFISIVEMALFQKWLIPIVKMTLFQKCLIFDCENVAFSKASNSDGAESSKKSLFKKWPFSKSHRAYSLIWPLSEVYKGFCAPQKAHCFIRVFGHPKKPLFYMGFCTPQKACLIRVFAHPQKPLFHRGLSAPGKSFVL